jgi:hypothetical protein
MTRPDAWSSRLVGTGVDPVTFRSNYEWQGEL